MKNLSYDLGGTLKEYSLSQARYLKYLSLHVLPNLGDLRRTASLQGRGRGKKAFVFANGPSLAQLDPNKVARYQNQGYEVFCVNGYVRSEFSKVVSPDYYLLSDPHYFGIQHIFSEDMEEVIRGLKGDVEVLKELGVPVFLPLQFLKGNSFKNYYVFNDYENLFGPRRVDLTKPRTYTSMTALKSLATACFMGFDQIYLCGHDNDYFKHLEVDDDNRIFYLDKHYFDKGVKREVSPQSGEGIGDLLWDYHFVFKHLADFFGEYPIVNLARNNLVDAFPKNHDLDVYA